MLTLILLSLLTRQVAAGLIASDVVVVVNANSLNSRTLANHYVTIRDIPAANVIVLDNVPNSEVVNITTFRDRILNPLLAEIDRRALASHIQCVVYSADFPTAIDITADIQPLGKLPVYITPRASINSLTYFYQLIKSNDPSYIGLFSNFYARREIDAYFSNPGGQKTEEVWKSIEQEIEAKEHQAAAEKLHQLFKDYPDQFPMAYLAAAQYSQANKTKEAVELLSDAVSKGWLAGGYIKQDERFAACRDNSEFQVLQLALDEDITRYQPTIGFDFKRAWAPNGVSSANATLGIRYVLCSVLGVTRGAGTSLEQAVEILERNAKADFAQPEGGFYFCLTSDVRTKTREPGFEETIKGLKKLGFEAEVISAVLPEQKKNVLGACIGTPNFDWSSCGSQLLPGSIVENLTSFGGDMSSQGGQTKLTELLKAGAAASSGTVTEPFSLQPKFPHPQMYLHYARGLSLGEAFYASVTGPYQLLIVGDPLCQPFAAPPKPLIDTSLRELAAGQALKLPLQFETLAHANQRVAPATPVIVGVMLDDSAPKAGLVQPTATINLVDQNPGYHELRLVFVGNDLLGQRSEVALPLWIGDKEFITITAPKSTSLRDHRITVVVKAPNAQSISVWHDYEQIAESEGDQHEFQISLDSLGMGPIRLHARAELANGKFARSQPTTTIVKP